MCYSMYNIWRHSWKLLITTCLVDRRKEINKMLILRASERISEKRLIPYLWRFHSLKCFVLFEISSGNSPMVSHRSSYSCFAASTSPGNVTEIRDHRLLPRPTNSKSAFGKDFKIFFYTLKFEKVSEKV